MDFDWLDDFLDNVDAEAELWQLNYIDNLLRSASLPPEEVDRIEYESSYYTQKEAAVKIVYLKENQVFTDPRDQFKFYNRLNK
jgi:hypothetical protein